ncbi:MAG: hypothetical protein DHS20C19_13010 [Acidimicrobiales bacterium]|nr:MAG: hypothetical protein DHS20C19_13010 [Acidimicrobiales bacterium]
MSDEFWDAAAPLLAEGLLEEGTIMGGPCARSAGEFVGMPHHKGDGIVVKLPRDEVDAMIAAGDGASFAPAGKVFREWVLVEAHDERQWTELLRRSVAFVNP